MQYFIRKTHMWISINDSNRFLISIKTHSIIFVWTFRRRVAAPVAERLTETQATVHRSQAWYHAAIARDKANKILAHHINTDGVFLVRESSVAGGFVISMTAANKTIHSQVLPVRERFKYL